MVLPKVFENGAEVLRFAVSGAVNCLITLCLYQLLVGLSGPLLRRFPSDLTRRDSQTVKVERVFVH
jgi:hypothetical protein